MIFIDKFQVFSYYTRFYKLNVMVVFPSLFNFVQLLCSLSGCLHLNRSSIGTGLNGAETSYRIAHNLAILLMKSNCFFFQPRSSYVCSDIYMHFFYNKFATVM